MAYFVEAVTVDQFEGPFLEGEVYAVVLTGLRLPEMGEQECGAA